MTDKQIIEKIEEIIAPYQTEIELDCLSLPIAIESILERKEQECKRWKEYFETAKEASNCNLQALGEMTEWADKLDEENDQLKEQLKRKEQECERLKNERTVDLVKQLDQLKAENDELKVQNIKYMNGNISYQLKNSLYKQTLTEIKFWARELLKRTGQVVPNEIKQILQKISEVEDD